MSSTFRTVWAFRWSLAALFPAFEQLEFAERQARGLEKKDRDNPSEAPPVVLSDPQHPLPNRGCFMWTLTAPDEAAQRDARELMKRFNRLMTLWRRKGGKPLRAIRVIEPGRKNGRLHFHFVTPDYHDVRRIRPLAEAAGFGRINAKWKPVEKARYVGKYLTKYRLKMPKGTRRWACIGFKGCRVNDVKFREKELTLLVRDTSLRSVTRWRDSAGDTLHEIVHRTDADSVTRAKETHTMTISNEGLVLIQKHLAEGKFVGLGEYRSAKKRDLTFTDDDRNKVTRHLVEHGIEFGGVAVQCSEWLPDGVTEIVKLPAQKGEPVLVFVDQYTKKYGVTTSGIISLANLNGKLK
jgi:hypothetical protein